MRRLGVPLVAAGGLALVGSIGAGLLGEAGAVGGIFAIALGATLHLAGGPASATDGLGDDGAGDGDGA